MTATKLQGNVQVSNDITSGTDSHPHGDVTSPPSGSLGKIFSLRVIL